MFLMISMMNLSLTIMFMFLNHPLSMGLTLMIQTIMVALITGFYSYSLWFSYILFLIMVGGMLVLFMYMTSLASNEKFKLSNKLLTFMLILSLTYMFMMLVMDMNFVNFMSKNPNMIELINNLNMLKNENMNSLKMMYNEPNFIITIMMINYLLLTLVAVVKITKSNRGPLRQKF
uniref:NADH-ubiquinone oxidoreductase chain 6 n=1 Tax=Nectoporus subrotundus TaxID=2811606 RepID=A0A894JXL8_9DYTI|nr:NADH dehydrogenase subunit 6 [Nectoporus subrotundus]QRV62800.1 NADH dehydrogenase subunit 6 [Nectoporus subrotundus]